MDFKNSIKFTAYDEDTTSNDHIGGMKTQFGTLCFNGGVDIWLQLYFGNKDAGKLRVISEFTPSI